MDRGGRLFRIPVITLSLGEPSEKRLGGLADLLAGREVDVLLAGFRAPLGDDIFREDILIVENKKDFGRLIVESSVLLASETNESFDSSKKSLLMLLRRDHLSNISQIQGIVDFQLTFLSMEARLGICFTMLSSNIV